MMERRDFLKGLLVSTFGFRAWGDSNTVATQATIIDGLGEIRLDYPMKLIDAILESGMSAVAITIGNPALQGPEALQDAITELAVHDAHVDANRDHLLKATCVADIETARRESRLALIYTLQNATPIQDKLDRIELLKNLGIRTIQLTYNSRNLLGDGCLERTNAGLSRFGIQVVERMNELGLVVDASHCGDATTLDAIQHSNDPISINHAGCKTVYDHPRNKTDAQLRALAERGGVIGMVQLNPFLSSKQRSDLDDYMNHLDHAVRTAGIDHVGIGSDREHRVIPDTQAEKRKLEEEISRLTPGKKTEIHWPYFLTELNHPRRMETIREALHKRKYSSTQIEKILGGNFMRLYRDVNG